MGIDVNQDRSVTYDRNKYYKGAYVDKMKLVQGAEAEGIFYSTDKIPFETQVSISGNVKKKQIIGTIETFDRVGDLTVDDYVLYRDELYIVDNVIADDKNENKEFSSRPSLRTEIRLRR